MRIALLVALTALVPLAGCQEIALVDDVDLTLDWTALLGPSDALHTPYVVGARFSVYVQTKKPEPLAGWRIESADESVLRSGQATLSPSRESLATAMTAGLPGQVELQVI